MVPEPPQQVENETEFQSTYFKVFNEPILCPCGCGSHLIGSDECVDEDDEGWVYNGEGFRCDNFNEQTMECKWCPYRDDYCICDCSACDDCDSHCEIYQYNNPVCGLNSDYLCEDPVHELTEDGAMHACEGHCEKCPLWKLYKPDEAQENKEEKKDE